MAAHEEQRPTQERHEGAITEPLEGQPLLDPLASTGEPPEPVAPASPVGETESHEGAITEPAEPPAPTSGQL